ncbi:hypothetical protein KV097_14540 [Mumia sp. zg.B17]|uniref:hypothetical protein n=1 Tax=Mumia sp. zg.B17 TaxID=2855446 RepID=UPI001C6DDDFE|nr:hypothetical protein [Mumia sp. zg.B17]MBW9207161.1 hypothetical protein [Mumia sp. zg.B17]
MSQPVDRPQASPTKPIPTSDSRSYDADPYGPSSSGSSSTDGDDTPRRGGAARHVVSLLAGLVLPPVAIVGFDWAFGRYWFDATNFRSFSDGETWPFAVAAVSGLLLLLTAAAGRLSPVGPMIAAVLYGAVPAAVIVLAREEIFRAAAEIRDWDWLYSQPLVNLPLYGFVLFPTIAALLLGTAIASAGRRR